jgi:hypothetical protein
MIIYKLVHFRYRFIFSYKVITIQKIQKSCAPIHTYTNPPSRCTFGVTQIVQQLPSLIRRYFFLIQMTILKMTFSLSDRICKTGEHYLIVEWFPCLISYFVAHCLSLCSLTFRHALYCSCLRWIAVSDNSLVASNFSWKTSCRRLYILDSSLQKIWK